jgi:hypothetical protein
LTSRGVTPAVALAILETTDAFASPVSSTLIRATLKTVTTKAVAPGVVALTEGVASVMISKSTIAVIAAVGLGLTGIGAAAWLKPTLAQDYLPQAEPNAEAPASPSDQKPSPRDVTRRHLKEILVALHNYHSEHGSFPAPFSVKDGKPLLSWRVAILPFLGENELYEQFQLGEPWHSPRNKILIDRMPAVFETFESPTGRGYTRIKGFIGPNAVFDPALTPVVGKQEGGDASKTTTPARRPGVSVHDITDGTSNTAFIGLARASSHWTAPSDIEFLPGVDIRNELDDSDPRGLVLGMCDGSVQVLPKARQDRQTLGALLTRNGGEVINSFTLFPRATAQPAAAPEAASSIEQRLQRVEEKLDRLLEKLDAK